MGLSKLKIQLLREYVDFTCEGCHKPEEEVGTLQPHRLKRGVEGGTYDYRNVKMLCDKCHKKYHQEEF